VGASSRIVHGSPHGVPWTLPPVDFWTGRAALPAACRDAAVTAAGGLVYVRGAVNSAGTALKTQALYTPSTNA